MTPRTWPDTYGVWHALVPSDEPAPSTMAREAIVRELADRTGVTFAPHAIRVERDPVNDSGDAIAFKEKAW